MRKNIFWGLMLWVITCNAQMDQYQFYVGAVAFSTDNGKDIRGIDKNAFANYGTSPMLGAGFSMYLSDNLRIGANFEGTATSKEYYAMSFFSINPNLNFHILPFDSRISPFLSLNGSLSFLNLSQQQYTYIAEPSPEYSVQFDTNPLITREEISMPYFYMQSQPLFGGGVGVGVDFKLKKHWGLIISGNYNVLFDETNPTINENLTFNEYNLAYASLQAMLRYRIF